MMSSTAHTYDMISFRIINNVANYCNRNNITAERQTHTERDPRFVLVLKTTTTITTATRRWENIPNLNRNILLIQERKKENNKVKMIKRRDHLHTLWLARNTGHFFTRTEQQGGCQDASPCEPRRGGKALGEHLHKIKEEEPSI